MSNSDNNPTKFYDLHTRGAGFLNRFREVKPKPGSGNKFKPFHSVSVGAFRGSEDNVEYTNFDTVISGKEALEILSQHHEAINDQQVRVIVGFTISDIFPYTYPVKKDGVDETRCGIKGRFLKVSFLKIDGETVYKYEKPTGDTSSNVPTSDDEQTSGTTSSEPSSETVASDACPFEEQLGNKVTLDSNDPAFDEKLAWLEASEYTFNHQAQAWFLN